MRILSRWPAARPGNGPNGLLMAFPSFVQIYASATFSASGMRTLPRGRGTPLRMHLPLPIHHADVHLPRVQIDSAVELRRRRVILHLAPPCCRLTGIPPRAGSPLNLAGGAALFQTSPASPSALPLGLSGVSSGLSVPSARIGKSEMKRNLGAGFGSAHP